MKVTIMTPRWAWPAILILAVLAGIVLVVLSARQPDHLRVGGAFALSGAAAGEGSDESRGAGLAFQEWFDENRRGDVDFMVVDAPADDVTTAVNAFRMLVESGAKVILGPTGADTATAIGPIADREKVLIISPVLESSAEALLDHEYFLAVCTSRVLERKGTVTQPMNAFRRSFEQEYGEAPRSTAAACAYDSARMLLHVVGQGYRKPEKIRSALSNLKKFDGIIANSAVAGRKRDNSFQQSN